jgi:hypothetical protein
VRISASAFGDFVLALFVLMIRHNLRPLSVFKIPKNLHLLPETAHVSSVSQVERIHTDRTLDLGISREVLFKL